jgi:carbamoyltransferase
MNILGLSCFYHDSAAALIADGIFVAGAHEERFTRIKHDSAFPENAILYCLKQAGMKPTDIDAVVYYEKPFLKFERILENYLDVAPAGFVTFSKAIPAWVGEKLFMRKHLGQSLFEIGFSRNVADGLKFSGHHLSHAASAFYSSPFSDSAILTIDGVGEWATATLGMGNEKGIEFYKELHYPDSPGLFYSSFTYFLGFRVNSGEYKVMGLAPYGKPIYSQIILEKLIDLKADGSFSMNQSYFHYRKGLTMTNQKFESLFGVARRQEGEEIEQIHMDIAASAQLVLEEMVLRMAKSAIVSSGSRNLCLAGGVALNCTANGRLLREDICDQLYVQPAAGDAGGALGAALAYWHLALKHEKKVSSHYVINQLQENLFNDEIDLNRLNAKFEKMVPQKLYPWLAEKLSEGKVVAWFDGEMEWGPRALGNRSILADPRKQGMKTLLNEKIKMREAFRPFAPAVMEDYANTYFETGIADEFMTRICKVKAEYIDGSAGFSLPAITHVDGTARVQIVSPKNRPSFYDLLKSFYDLTGCAMLVNTSFNLRGEPPVCTVKDAYSTFMHSGIDILVVNGKLLLKENQTVVPNAPILSGD